MQLDTLLQGGTARIILPFPIQYLLFIIPTALLAYIISREKMSTVAKQVLSIPLLTMVFITPIAIGTGNGVMDLVAGVACYNLFLRLFEFYWISPLLYGKPAYAPTSYLYTEFWACLCKFPKPNKKKDDDAKPKEYVKDKKAYHILMYLAYHAAVCDVLGSWFNTFSGNDVIVMRQDRPGLFFTFLFLIVILLNSAFNIFGYGLHLFHCLVFDHGSYSSEQWRSLMINPIISNSLEELWSTRWHQLLHTSWVAFAFRPVRYIIQRLTAKTNMNPGPIILVASSLAVFFVSGMMHEYLVYANIGWSIYSRFFVGQQVAFFFIHGIGMMVEKNVAKVCRSVLPAQLLDSFFVKHILQRVWVITYAYLTFPYFMDGFGYWGLWHDNPFTFSRGPVEQLLRAIPNGQAYCGSLL
ncbi:hypothetical protein BJV82DRAFT_624910 [Fennellomyces sp. T-0311]|nr:hypothetical protein BJV82DRAFT_624910 [Fennellomyces sp. T-0311]